MSSIDTARTITIAPQPGPQELMLSCPVTEIFFGGARGGGKSWAVCLDWHFHAMTHGKNARGLILRESFQALNDWNNSKAYALLPHLGWKYKVGAKEWHHPNGAMLRLGFIDKQGDEDKYQGNEYTWLCFEEIGNWKESQKNQLDALRACMRSPAGVPPRIVATGNPGGAGHEWVKARYIDPSPAMTPFYNEETGTTMIYIPSRFEDNVILKQNDPNYLDRIVGPPHLKRAWKLGDWNISPTGNVFLNEWWRYYGWHPSRAALSAIGGGNLEIPAFMGIIQVWDTAYDEKSQNDYSVCITAAYTKTDVYILDVWRKKVVFPDLVKAAKDLAAKWHPNLVLIEGKASGKSLVQTLKVETMLPVKTASAQDDKLSRANSVAPIIEAGRVHLPEIAPWLEIFLVEVSSFPEGSHDDIVDALAHLLKRVAYAGFALQKLEEKRARRQRSIYAR